jgi:cellulose synthase/poly-beta-1,6-N-acetylglucosamine synthase-like glycosyltransferase
MLISFFIFCVIVFSASYGFYFAYVRRESKKPWTLAKDENYQPLISILIPMHNEEAAVEKKLANVAAVSYPKDNLEVVIADDASEDATLMRV